jgi:hypothetical protein
MRTPLAAALVLDLREPAPADIRATTELHGGQLLVAMDNEKAES